MTVSNHVMAGVKKLTTGEMLERLSPEYKVLTNPGTSMIIA